MQVSLGWLEELLGTSLDLGRVAEALTLGGLEVEHIAHHGAHLDRVVVARVLSSRAHPSSKNPLTLVTVDLGDETTEVVCGAPNVPAPGGLVCFARLGATVFGKGGAPMVLEAKPIAGITSTGMLCAEDELGLGTDHHGIIVLDGDLAPGTPLDTLAGMRDAVLTLNVTPNRGDALSHLGVARDVAAMLGLDAPKLAPITAAAGGAPARESVAVTLSDPRCGRYIASVVRALTVKPSPLALRVRLHRLGVRPINNLVDVTNLVMLETGQPLHAFDRRHLKGDRIEVRAARPGERLETLDGVVRALDPDDLVIADGDAASALAGIMGGQGSGIADDTAEVVLEVARFDPRAVRKTARRFGMHTESSHRFERGTDPDAIAAVAARAAAWLAVLGGGVVAPDPVDVNTVNIEPKTVSLRTARTEALLGVALSAETQGRYLARLGFGVRAEGATLVATVPGWRNDVTREVDLIEEVGRVHGFDKLIPVLPPTRGARAGATRDWHLRRRVRETLASLGLDEAVFPVFVTPRDIGALGLDPAEAPRLTNPLSEERAVLRSSLLPRLVVGVGNARRRGEPRVRLFEIGAVFGPGAPGDALPREETRLAVALAGPRDTWLSKPDEVDLFDLKGVIEELAARTVHGEATFHRDGEAPPWAHPKLFARVRLGAREVGAMGALHPDVVARADLGRTAFVAELDLAAFGVALGAPRAKAPPRFPAVRRDVALLVNRDVPAGQIAETLATHAGPLCREVKLFDRYLGRELPEGTHSLAFAMTFRADDRSLEGAEVETLSEAALKATRAHFQTEQR
ncbi:MAG: phenylalanine--tRNA ligase subunit beta [Myxococcales bacterium]|nr:phenylalanine--tRNA ligase subunit beta [Myxococcales bacterium]